MKMHLQELLLISLLPMHRTRSLSRYLLFTTATHTGQAKNLRAAECSFWNSAPFTAEQRAALCYNSKTV